MLKPNATAPDRARIETLEFRANNWVPNSRLPVMLIRAALGGATDDAAIHELYRANGWGGTWTWTVYDFHHYHSTAHEALAVARGEAVLMLGGPEGREVTVWAGDLVVLPAGTGHKRLAASAAFAVCGAYPPGQEADLLTATEQNWPGAEARIAAVLLPRTDPFYGAQGPLIGVWQDAAAES